MVDLANNKLMVGEQLSATYTSKDVKPQLYYRHTCHQHLSNVLAKARELVHECLKAGFIHYKDAKEMVPDEAKLGHYYSLAKMRKVRWCWPGMVGCRCPLLHPVVSSSGMVT